MNHPFNLDISDLEVLASAIDEPFMDAEANLSGAGSEQVTTLALGEEGGIFCPPVIKYPRPIKLPIKIRPPRVTTLAIGEEGGSPFIEW